MSNLPSGAVPMPRQETEPTVCGYRNHETFVVAMRLNNTSADYSAQIRNLVADAKGQVLAGKIPGGVPDEHSERLVLAEMLCKRIETECRPVPRGALSSLGDEMLTLALASVDWEELAQEWLGDAAERAREATP